MAAGADVSLWLAFAAGVLSFISPCCLPLYPSFLSYITGVSVKDLHERKGIWNKSALLHTFFFILGFSIIFLALGFSASWVGQLFSSNRVLIQQIGGVLIIFMGLVMLKVITPDWLLKERRFNLETRPVGYLGSVVVGIIYAAGWTPCVGPILAAIITLGVSNPDQAIVYLLAYNIGFALPFLLMAFLLGRVKAILKYSETFMKVGGAMMVVTGILLYTDQMTKITTLLIDLYGGFTGF